MPKLLQLNVTANWGSTGKIADGIGQAAIARGWESFIAYGRYSNSSTSHLIKVGDKKNVYLHYAKNRFFDAEGLGSKRATKNLIKQIKEIKPNIIHLHNIHDHWLNYPILFEYLANINTPIVWTFHDCWAFTGGCAYFDSIDCQKWQTKCDNCSMKKFIDRSKRNFELKLSHISKLKNKLTIIPVSDWMRDFCKKSFLKDFDIKMVHNGIDCTKFQPVGCKEKLVLGVALPWSARKGLNDAIKLRNLLPSDVNICLVGLDDKQVSTLPDGIQYIKRTQNIDELVSKYSNASVFINPTYSDNFPTVNLEALACGTPVVTYRTGGSPEAVDEKTGIVVDKGDVNALADAVMHVIKNPESFKSEDCRLRAVTNFNKDVQFGKYVDLYESLLNN